MIRNYLKIAWRNLMKNRTFSFINIFGLAVGFTCCFLICLYLYNELRYDAYHTNGDRIYQLGTTFIRHDKPGEMRPQTPAPMAAAMQQEFPEIEKTTRLIPTFVDDKTLLQYTPEAGTLRSFYEKGGYLADSTFFELFNYRFREGNPALALRDPNSLVLSEAIARKLFSNESALNKTVHISSSTNGDHDFKVTGVFLPSPGPSHIDAQFFMSMMGGDVEQFVRNRTELASNNMFFTYLLLKPGSDASRLEAKFPAFIDKYAGKDLKAAGFYKKQFLIPLHDIHLDTRMKSNVTANASVTYLYILASIALFILLIACINFMNLSTARSSRRSAEVGVRKVLGAEKGALITQFLGESVLMALIAFVLSLGMTRLLLPLFSELSGKTFPFSTGEYVLIAACFFGLAVVTGLLAGSYPAFYLSSFKPVRVLKGKFTNSFAARSLRRTLVVVQFVVSVVLIIASVVIHNQMTYMRSKDLGFDKEQQLVIPLRSAVAKKGYAALRTELEKQQGIRSVGASQYYPGIFNPRDMSLYKDGETMSDARHTFINQVDDNFLKTLNIQPVAGRLFSKAFVSDSIKGLVINEECARQLDFASPDAAIGKKLYFDWHGTRFDMDVVGVVKDFHFQDLHHPIEPFGFLVSFLPDFGYVIAHLDKDAASVLPAIESVWTRLNPNEPFEYSFLDEDFSRNFEAEQRLAAIVRSFTIIAILISCLGLFGLAAFSAEQRTKEIGIRKVLGASSAHIVGLLSKEFLKLVVIAIVIATPLAWYAMSRWLEDFAYRVSIGWWMFGMAAALSLVIAFATIGMQALKAANANPVKNLRSE